MFSKSRWPMSLQRAYVQISGEPLLKWHPHFLKKIYLEENGDNWYLVFVSSTQLFRYTPFSFLEKICVFLFICVYVWGVYESVCVRVSECVGEWVYTTYVWVLGPPKEGVGASGSEVRESWATWHGCWDPNLGPLEGQQALLSHWAHLSRLRFCFLTAIKKSVLC